jgi:hypothetical protein
MILIVFNLVYAGRAIERMIIKPDCRTWMDWLEFGFFLFMGVTFIITIIGMAAT